ncbi:MAG: hypothetical protein M3328_03980, partial [Chloroflexota bacterium]|nr:hypothetical protein [Chloroflexota bacterium]
MGTVTDLKEDVRLDANAFDYTVYYTYVFQVLTSWKGVSQSRVTVHWERHFEVAAPGEHLIGPPCGPVGYDQGPTYLVYANYECNILTAMIYSGRNDIPVRSVGDAAEEFRVFGSGIQWNQSAG